MSTRTTSVPAAAARLYNLLAGRFDKQNPFVLEKPDDIIQVMEHRYANDAEPNSVEVTALWPSAGSITVRTVKHWRKGCTNGVTDEFSDIHIYDSFTDDPCGSDFHWHLDNLEKEVNRQLERRRQTDIKANTKYGVSS